MHIQFAGLPVHDQTRARRFYVDHFGCTVAADAPMGADGWRWIELAFPGSETRLHSSVRVPTMVPTCPLWCWSTTTWRRRSAP